MSHSPSASASVAWKWTTLPSGTGAGSAGLVAGRAVRQEAEPFGDAVGGDHRVDHRPDADGDLAVGAVHGGLVSHPACPVAGRTGAEMCPHRAAARGDRLGEPGRAVAEPGRPLGRVVGQPAVRHLTERDRLGRLGGHDRGGPPVRPPDVSDELPQRPVRAGRHRGGEVCGGGDPGQRVGAAGHLGEQRSVEITVSASAWRWSGRRRSAAAAGTAAAAAPAARARRRGARPAAHGHRGEQLHRVVMPLRALGRCGGLGHGPVALEGRAACAAAVLIPWHARSLRHTGATGERRGGAARRRGLPVRLAAPSAGPATAGRPARPAGAGGPALAGASS